MKDKLDRQIQLAVRDAVIRLSRDDVPDTATLALAIASGETAQTLADKAQEKIDRRTAKPETEAVPAPTAPVPAAEPVPTSHPARSHHKK